jgi:hypothetical protein
MAGAQSKKAPTVPILLATTFRLAQAVTGNKVISGVGKERGEENREYGVHALLSKTH